MFRFQGGSYKSVGLCESYTGGLLQDCHVKRVLIPIWGSLDHTSGKSPDPIDMGEPGGGWGPQAGGFQFRAGFTRDLDFR